MLNLSLSSLDVFNSFSGFYNLFIYPTILYLDVNLANINDSQSSIQYIFMKIVDNPLIEPLSLPTAWCLEWPNLSVYHVEKYTNPIESLKTKMLVIAETKHVDISFNESLIIHEYINI